ncbi:uncharacterized protein LOC108735362 [Agrilus planipennis]|uniref:Uncharacterized protein LOC108735362 n=1 Tax=Agrilus planipennis TaxID=224129 RepID=A0A1W4WQP9_AGRPL|nr:uncharacterized protein LOC108735362 [Agrilus planipennis]
MSSSKCRSSLPCPPTDWPSDPELWFCMVERSFEASGTDLESTRLGYVLGNLDPRYAAEAALIRQPGISQETRMKQLFESGDLGDRKPTQFLRHLRGLAGTTMPDNLLRTIWSSRLPLNVQAIIATMWDKDLDETAGAADCIMEAIQTETIAAVTPTTSSIPETIQTLTNTIYTLRMDLNNMR